MIVAIGSAVIPIGTRNAHMVNLPVGSQATQIAIDRAAADLIVYFADILIYLFGTRMIAVCLHGFQNCLPLLCFPVPPLNRFKIGNSVLAYGANIVIRKRAAFVDIPAYPAYKARLLLRLRLGLDIVLIVGIAHGFFIG